jgi:hypothetical protein
MLAVFGQLGESRALPKKPAHARLADFVVAVTTHPKGGRRGTHQRARYPRGEKSRPAHGTQSSDWRARPDRGQPQGGVSPRKGTQGRDLRDAKVKARGPAYTLVGTAKRNGLNPGTTVRGVQRSSAVRPDSRDAQLRPDHFQPDGAGRKWSTSLFDRMIHAQGTFRSARSCSSACPPTPCVVRRLYLSIDFPFSFDNFSLLLANSALPCWRVRLVHRTWTLRNRAAGARKQSQFVSHRWGCRLVATGFCTCPKARLETLMSSE